MTDAEQTRKALRYSAGKAYAEAQRDPFRTPDPITVAVNDVIEALRYNPGWAKSLGIGGRP